MIKKKVLLYAQSASKTRRSLANMEMVGDLLAKATGGGIIPIDAKPSRETAAPAGQADEAAVSRALQPKP